MTDDHITVAGEQAENESYPIYDGSLLMVRDRELAQFDAILDRRQPVLVVVSGEPDIGKTTLLREVQRRASKRGWRTALSDGQVDLRVEPDTTIDDFSRRVRKLLDIPEALDYKDGGPENLISDKTAKDSSQCLPSMPLGDVSDEKRLDDPNPESPEPASTNSREALSEHIPDGSAQPPKQTRQSASLVEQLRSLDRALLLIDGYRPEPGFAGWFEGHFIRDVKQSGTSLVVVVADRPGLVRRLDADEHISLGPPDERSIRRELEKIGRQITPPMETAELEMYVKEVSEKPVRFDGLTRLLRLAQTNEQ
ncbi:MAG: ATP-binding protein [Terriglobia bacterium]